MSEGNDADAEHTLWAIKRSQLVLYVTYQKSVVFNAVSLLDLGMNDTQRCEFCLPCLINTATVPYEIWNTENACQHKFSF